MNKCYFYLLEKSAENLWCSQEKFFLSLKQIKTPFSLLFIAGDGRSHILQNVLSLGFFLFHRQSDILQQ